MFCREKGQTPKAYHSKATEVCTVEDMKRRLAESCPNTSEESNPGCNDPFVPFCGHVMHAKCLIDYNNTMKNNKCPVCSRPLMPDSDTKKKLEVSVWGHNALNDTGNPFSDRPAPSRQVLVENARIRREDLLARHPRSAADLAAAAAAAEAAAKAAAEAEEAAAKAVAEAEESVIAAYNDEILNPNWIRDQTPDSDMWPTNPGRYRPSVHNQATLEAHMRMHTVKNNALEEQESSHPVTEHPIDVQAFRSAICTYWNCRTDPRKIFRLYAEWVFYEPEILRSLCAYLSQTFNFESEETGRYGRKLPDIDAAIGWIRDNIHHEDFSVDDSNQRLDRLREGLTTDHLTDSMYDWGSLSHHMSPNGGFMNQSPIRSYGRLITHEALMRAIKFDGWLDLHELPARMEGMEHLANDGALGYLLAAIIVAEDFTSLRSAIGHLQSIIGRDFGNDPKSDDMNEVIAEFAETHTIDDLAEDIDVLKKIVLDLADDNGQSGGLTHTRGNLNYVTKITPVRRVPERRHNVGGRKHDTLQMSSIFGGVSMLLATIVFATLPR
jgi:hypothetical protein